MLQDELEEASDEIGMAGMAKEIEETAPALAQSAGTAFRQLWCAALQRWVEEVAEAAACAIAAGAAKLQLGKRSLDTAKITDRVAKKKKCS